MASADSLVPLYAVSVYPVFDAAARTEPCGYRESTTFSVAMQIGYRESTTFSVAMQIAVDQAEEWLRRGEEPVGFDVRVEVSYVERGWHRA